jgi:hypothetical protein
MALSTSNGEKPSSLSVFIISGSDKPCEERETTLSVGILGPAGAAAPAPFFLDMPNMNQHRPLYLLYLMPST